MPEGGRYILNRRAHRDIEDCANDIAGRNAAAGYRFFEAVERGFEQFADHPGLGELYELDDPRLSGLRRGTVPGFKNYQIFYLTTADGIEVVRVLHGARDLDAIFRGDGP